MRGRQEIEEKSRCEMTRKESAAESSPGLSRVKGRAARCRHGLKVVKDHGASQAA